MKRATILLVLALFSAFTYGQELKSPDQFLGYKLGSQFTYHHMTVGYFEYIAEQSPNVSVIHYGKTNEGRPLMVAFISSEKILKKLESMRESHLASIGLLEGTKAETVKPIVWLSYNVHGNESTGMETSMKTLYTLVSGSFEGTKEWLDECIIVIDPCQNPDGRDLYATRYRQRQPIKVNPDPNDWSHDQPWPSARSNHYLFDLNRDWAWMTQAETQQRLALYNMYMPHVHADFHEMGANSPYFFPPGADPWHKIITKWQHEFHSITGKANAALFDEKARLYFTKESFDLFCPSFGDTWPLFNGAMGFTYEQGGGGQAGLAMEISNGDTLTLETRIEGHFLSSMATIKAAYEQREKLVKEFVSFFATGLTEPGFEYKSIIIKGSNNNYDIESLCKLLDANQIRYEYATAGSKSYEGFDYLKNSNGKTTIDEGDILVSAYQPQSHMVEVLFEPDSKFTDSLSYDLTGWALPYLYNLKAFAIKERIRGNGKKVQFEFTDIPLPSDKPYAYLVAWQGFGEAKLLAELYSKKVNVRYNTKPFTMGGTAYPRGSLIIARGDNRQLGDKFDLIVNDASNNNRIMAVPVATGYSDKGIDLGSNYAELIKPPRVALVGGDGTSQYSFAELWYFFEQELGYQVTIIDASSLQGTDLGDYDVLFLPSGSYSRAQESLTDWVKAGGRLIALERSATMFASDKSTKLYEAVEKQKKEKSDSEKKVKTDDPSLLKTFENQRRDQLSSRSASSIYRVKIDNTHPYTYGMGTEWFIIKRANGFPYLSSGLNIAYINESDPVSGFAGTKFIEEVKNTLVLGSERVGRGEIVYLSDSPYYRAFWKSGRVLLSNLAFR